MTSRELSDAMVEALRAKGALPVPLKAMLAGTLMCARGGSPTRLGMSKVGGYSYGSSQNHYANLLDAIVERLPSFVAGMATDEIDPVAAAQRRKDIRQRDETIAALRLELKSMTQKQETLRRYSLALHERLREINEQEATDVTTRVRSIHPLE